MGFGIQPGFELPKSTDFGIPEIKNPLPDFDKLGVLKNLKEVFDSTNIRKPKKAQDDMNFFDYPATTIDGKVYAELREMLKDKKATLVVNVA